MNAAIAAHQADLENLCQRFHVRRLDLFGSALDAAFDTARSDLDFLVEFEVMPDGEYASTYFDFKDALERLFERSVDLVVASAIRNPYFRQSVERGKALVYAA